MDDVVRHVLENQHRLSIGRRIGRGGSAGVYKARSAAGMRCAVQVSLDLLGESPALRQELENLRLVQAVTGHPNVATLTDVWLADGYPVTRRELPTEGSMLDMLTPHEQQSEPVFPSRSCCSAWRKPPEGSTSSTSRRSIATSNRPICSHSTAT